jgi:hypothetical protein
VKAMKDELQRDVHEIIVAGVLDEGVYVNVTK